MKKIAFAIACFVIGVLVMATPASANAAAGNLWIDPEVDMIQGWGWMTGAIVVVTINEDEFQIAAGEGGNFVLTLTGTGYEINAGDEVTATHAGSSTSHTVTALTLDQTFYPFDTNIRGTAAPDSEVVVWLSDFGQFGRNWLQGFTVTADGTGVWTLEGDFNYEEYLADHSMSDLEWKDVHVFQPDDVFTYQNDPVDEGNATLITRSGDPGGVILGVYPQLNTIWGHSWPYGNLVLEVQKGSQKFTYNHGLHSGGDFRLHYDDHKFSLEPGNLVTARIGDFELTTQVFDIRITEIDLENDVIKGIGAPNVDVSVEVGSSTWDPTHIRSTTAGSDGKWQVDFSEAVEDFGHGWGEAYDIVELTNIWVYTGEEIDTPSVALETFGRTIITNLRNVKTLVREFIITRMTEFAHMTSNIATVIDDPSEDLIFESEAFGRIVFKSFDIEALLLINPQLLENLGDLVVITYDAEKKTISTKVDTSALEFLAGHGATIQFFDVAKKLGVTGLTSENVRNYLDIKVYDGGQPVTDLSKYFDWDNVVYDATTDVLTLPVNHFTEYVLGASTELPETGTPLMVTAVALVAAFGGAAILKVSKKFEV